MNDVKGNKRVTEAKSGQFMQRSLTAMTAKPVAMAPVDVGVKAAPHQGEIGGPKGPDPTRYGDWERKGRCIDF